MRILWTLLKVIIGLAIAIPVGLFALTLVFGVVGSLLRIAVIALKLACVAFVGFGAFKLVSSFFGSPKPKVEPVRDLPRPDPYYEAAMRELDAEFRQPSR